MHLGKIAAERPDEAAVIMARVLAAKQRTQRYFALRARPAPSSRPSWATQDQERYWSLLIPQLIDLWKQSRFPFDKIIIP